MNTTRFVPFTLLAMLLLAACTLASPASNNTLSSASNTQPAVTATAIIPLSGPTVAPTSTETPLPAPTDTLTPAQTPTQAATLAPTLAPTQVPAPTLAPVALCNQAAFVGDVTIPDGSVLDPGTTFTKTWELQNTGSCSWTSGYAFVFASGSQLSGPSAVELPYTVNPGGTVNLSVDFTAPDSAGTYQGNWMLRDANGNLFGTGTNAGEPVWVNIVVSSSATFAVTEVDVSASPTVYNGVCPTTITYTANIYSNNAGSVTYYWKRSFGTNSAEQTLTFTGAGNQTVIDTFSLGAAGDVLAGWDQLYIDQPNHQLFDPVSFSVACFANTPTPTSTPTLVPTATRTPTPTLTLTATKPAPTATATKPAPTATKPAPTATATKPAPTATPSASKAAPSVPTATPSATQKHG